MALCKTCGKDTKNKIYCSRVCSGKGNWNLTVHRPARYVNPTNGYLRCRRCQKEKSSLNFQLRDDQIKYPGRRKTICVACLAELAHPFAEYSILKIETHDCCYLCGRARAVFKKRLSVDHDHKCCSTRRGCSNCIRGLLCDGCNRNILPYLEKYPRLQNDLVKQYLARRPLLEAPIDVTNVTKENETHEQQNKILASHAVVAQRPNCEIQNGF